MRLKESIYAKTGGRCMTQLAKMSKLIELTADVYTVML